MPHLVQKPSVRPVLVPRERPTGAPHSEREQNRLRSGTSGFSMIAVRGSGRGTSGTVTRPAPRRLRPEAAVDLPEERTETERDVVAPDSARESLPETERREVAEREERDAWEDARELLCTELLPEPREEALPPPVMPVAVAAIMPFGDTTGASPQVSQYSSPPPMSS
ncbi:hypothetical protein GCM10010329_38350 [Streptomyces spiroverticillatus]|uniref:Uncharacterized protein n=1 Tax=Streptomyces finlayi TaxID=67296 RepID=A0A918WY48_9ACTN|nr:hypothetical protein GCM10010329_38350 [Streptomyces spiroverticillatus]GHC94842.1 hypothetical protein GCM10010334_33260 [Streptomyces finlayi]